MAAGAFSSIFGSLGISRRVPGRRTACTERGLRHSSRLRLVRRRERSVLEKSGRAQGLEANLGNGLPLFFNFRIEGRFALLARQRLQFHW